MRLRNILDSLVKRVGAAVVDLADDVARHQDRDGLGLEPVRHPDAIAVQLLAEDLMQLRAGAVAKLGQLPQLPEDLQTGALGVLLGIGIEDMSQRAGNLESLVLLDVADGAQVDVHSWAVGEPLLQLGIRLRQGRCNAQDRSAGDEVIGLHQREVELGQTAHEDLESLMGLVDEAQGGDELGARRILQVLLGGLALLVLDVDGDGVHDVKHVEGPVVPGHGVLEAGEDARQLHAGDLALRRHGEVLDGVRAEADVRDVEVREHGEAGREETVEDDEVGADLVDDLDDGLVQLDHLLARVRDQHGDGVADGGERVARGQGRGEVRHGQVVVLARDALAVKVRLHTLVHGETIDVVVDDGGGAGRCALDVLIGGVDELVEALGRREVHLDGGIDREHGVSCGQEAVGLAVVLVGEHEDLLGPGGCWCGHGWGERGMKRCV